MQTLIIFMSFLDFIFYPTIVATLIAVGTSIPELTASIIAGIKNEKQLAFGNIIGSNILLKNSVIGNNVIIQDGCKIGLKGFGFIPMKNKNLKFVHKGNVYIHDDVEIASSCTIDRGSIAVSYTHLTLPTSDLV